MNEQLQLVLTREIVSTIFVCLSGLYAPFNVIIGADIGPTIDFASCLALALVSRHFANCWRRFQVEHVLPLFEAIQRGRQLKECWQKLLSTPTVWTLPADFDFDGPGGCGLFVWMCSKLPSISNFVTLGSVEHRQFYTDRRCVLEAMRAGVVGVVDFRRGGLWSVVSRSENKNQPAPALDVSRLDAANISAPCDFSGLKSVGGATPWRLLLLLYSSFGKPVGQESSSAGIAGLFTALRCALQCPSVFGGIHDVLALPSVLFARSTDGQNVSLRDMTHDIMDSVRPQLVGAVERALLESPAERLRAMAFVLFRCAAAVCMPPQGGCNDLPKSRQQVDRLADEFHACYGIRLSTGPIASVADRILYKAQILDTVAEESGCTGEQFRMPIEYARLSIAVQTRALAQTAPGRSLRFSRQHPGAAVFALYTDRLFRVLQRTEGTAFITLTLPDELGLVPTIRFLRHPTASTSLRLLMLSSLHSEPENAHVAAVELHDNVLPFLVRDAGWRDCGSWTDIAHWRAAGDSATTDHALSYTNHALHAFDVRLDNRAFAHMRYEQRYIATILESLRAHAVSHRPYLALESLAARLNYLFEHLAHMVRETLSTDAALKLLDSCTAIVIHCRYCEYPLPNLNKQTRILCDRCEEQHSLLKRKAVPV